MVSGHHDEMCQFDIDCYCIRTIVFLRDSLGSQMGHDPQSTKQVARRLGNIRPSIGQQFLMLESCCLSASTLAVVGCSLLSATTSCSYLLAQCTPTQRAPATRPHPSIHPASQQSSQPLQLGASGSAHMLQSAMARKAMIGSMVGSRKR